MEEKDIENKQENEQEFLTDMRTLKHLKDAYQRIPRNRRQHDVCMKRYFEKLYELGGKYHMEPEELVLNMEMITCS